jgi:RND superfamily putative drug exporter
VSYAVTGDTASSYDFTQHMHSGAPIVFAAVAVAAFVLLAVAFESIVVPLVSIALNLLSVGAAYGLITHLQGVPSLAEAIAVLLPPCP